MRALVALLAFVLAIPCLAQSPQQSPGFEDFTFIWNLAKEGDASLAIVKTAETTAIQIKSASLSAIQLTPEEAAKIGAALDSTAKMADKLKGAKADADETLDAGDFTVRFSQSPKYGFSVFISSKQLLGLSNVSLDRKQAAKFAPLLKRAVELAKRTDTILDKALTVP